MILTYYTTIEGKFFLNILDDSKTVEMGRHVQIEVQLTNIMRLNTEGSYLVSKANNVFSPQDQKPTTENQ